MTDLERRLRLHIENRLAELGGAVEEELPAGPGTQTSWGSVGSLAAAEMPAASLDQLLSLHRQMLQQARSRYEPDQPAESGGPVHQEHPNGRAAPIRIEIEA